MTARFFLVRHAAAAGSAPGGDAARPLTPAGRDAFAAHARRLAPELPLRRILSSPFIRAQETAELLAAATGAPVEVEPALASGASSARALLALARACGDGAALVGHNPEIAEAVARASGGAQPVEPGTIVAIDDDGTALKVAWVRSVGG